MSHLMNPTWAASIAPTHRWKRFIHSDISTCGNTQSYTLSHSGPDGQVLLQVDDCVNIASKIDNRRDPGQSKLTFKLMCTDSTGEGIVCLQLEGLEQECRLWMTTPKSKIIVQKPRVHHSVALVSPESVETLHEDNPFREISETTRVQDSLLSIFDSVEASPALAHYTGDQPSNS